MYCRTPRLEETAGIWNNWLPAPAANAVAAETQS
jgi:hypothetical protein